MDKPKLFRFSFGQNYVLVLAMSIFGDLAEILFWPNEAVSAKNPCFGSHFDEKYFESFGKNR